MTSPLYRIVPAFLGFALFASLTTNTNSQPVPKPVRYAVNFGELSKSFNFALTLTVSQIAAIATSDIAWIFFCMNLNRPLSFAFLRLRTVAVVSSVLTAAGLLFMAPVLAKEKPGCDCFEVKFEPSRERIKITHSPEVKRAQQAAKAAKPSEVELLKKIVTTADTFVQRHTNGEIYQDQDPDGWDAYNGPIMAVPLDAWMRLRSERGDKDGSQWNLCPAAKLVSVGYQPNKTVVQYEFLTVGRFTNAMKGLDPFTGADAGKVFTLDVIINDQAKIVDMRQSPIGRWSYPYTQSVKALKKNLKRKGRSDAPAAEVERLAAHKKIWTKQLNELLHAAKVCTTNKNQGE